MDSLETPLDPLSPSSSGYYSPIGSDAIQTPFIEEHAGGRIYADPREPEASVFDYVGSPSSPETRRKGGYEYTSDVNSPSHKFSQSSLVSPILVSPRYRSYSSFSLTPDGRTCGDKNLEENPFELMFSPELLEDALDDSGDAPRPPDEELDRPPDDPAACDIHFNYDAHMHSEKFPEGHQLNRHFVRNYVLEDQLGAGGYGFVMTAHHRERGYEVAVKFIIKEKVPDGAWMVDEVLGKLPAEVLLLCFIDHENIVKCLDLYEDKIYYYMASCCFSLSAKNRPLHLHPSLKPKHQSCLPQPCNNTVKKLDPSKELAINRPEFSRRPSHDLFECIEQSEHKRLSQEQARYVFKQIVEAVYYLHVQGVSHRDLKDENVVIDRNFKAKLIDFGSAVIVDPSKPRPFYDVFFGTTAYAASEILLKRPYQAAPAEVWTLGVLLSYLLTGSSPFPLRQDAIDGNIVLCGSARQSIPPDAMDLLKRCLLPDPTQRITIAEVKEHAWLKEPEN
ncbi:hypothetical protein PTI98_006090 [Pleurotus ostreatus]|nr:hypothetical protein PTI98_006090 [Pleurotus ostreatus]